MSIHIDQWRARIGSFIQKIGSVRTGSTRYYRYLNIVNFKVTLFFLFFCVFLLTHGDIVGQPWVYKKTSNYFSWCHWNVNNILAHNKISLLTGYNIVQKFSISETYLDSAVDNKTIEIKGYHLTRADYPNNQRRGGVCLYFKGNSCLRQTDISFFPECLLCQININNKKDYIIVLYRSPSQTSFEFNNF